MVHRAFARSRSSSRRSALRRDRYSVSRRVREIGIRKALGAQSAQLLSMVMGEGMLLVGIGGAIGAVLAAGAAQCSRACSMSAPWMP